jgi:hypothetical protein
MFMAMREVGCTAPQGSAPSRHGRCCAAQTPRGDAGVMAAMNPQSELAPPPTGPMSRRPHDDPAYRLLHTLGHQIEIRRYAACAVAEVFVPGPPHESRERALPMLTDYLAGENLGAYTLTVTSPVTHSALDGGTLVRLALPAGMTPATAPKPRNARVVRRTVAGQTLAALRYSGRWSQAIDDAQLARLAAALGAAKLGWTGQPRYARYNAAWTPWFLRRNEVWLHLP